MKRAYQIILTELIGQLDANDTGTTKHNFL